MKLKTGDMVVVTTGKDRKKTGKIMRVLVKTDRVVIEGVNKVTRHVKKRQGQAGQKVEFEAPIHSSNVMFFDPKTKQATRVGYRVTKDGKKERVSKKSNTVI
jgi:large subunit ribosomal protein L24